MKMNPFLKFKFPLKEKFILMVAPSFICDFGPSEIIYKAKRLGFDKVVEVTFGAKMINREYHSLLKNKKGFFISSTCPGIVSFVKTNFPEFRNNLIKIDSPMIAMAKICKKHFPEHKVVFLSPCNFKKLEIQERGQVDYFIDFKEFKLLVEKNKIFYNLFSRKRVFDKFYNDYTKIYPLSGALSKTAHLKNVLKKEESICIDGIKNVKKFLKNKKSKIRFVDCLFCEGGCIGGPHTNPNISLEKKEKKIKNYLKNSKRKDIPEDRKGLIKKAAGLNFYWE